MSYACRRSQLLSLRLLACMEPQPPDAGIQVTPMPIKLLIVDDEPKIRSMLTGCLEQDGRAITAAASGEEALRLIAQDPPQLMIVDMKMPGLTGLEVLQQVRTHTPPIGVFLLTGYDDDAIEQQARELGAWGIIHKPPVFADIRQLITDAIAKFPPS